MEARTLSNPDLVAYVKRLAAAGCRVEADLLEHLAEVDRRRLYLDEGCPSMFAYCTEVLHFSEAVTYNRIVVARASREYAEILEISPDCELWPLISLRRTTESS